MSRECEIHGIYLGPDGTPCPMCSRTDENIIRILRDIIEMKKEIAALRKSLEAQCRNSL